MKRSHRLVSLALPCLLLAPAVASAEEPEDLPSGPRGAIVHDRNLDGLPDDERPATNPMSDRDGDGIPDRLDPSPRGPGSAIDDLGHQPMPDPVPEAPPPTRPEGSTLPSMPSPSPTGP